MVSFFNLPGCQIKRSNNNQWWLKHREMSIILCGWKHTLILLFLAKCFKKILNVRMFGPTMLSLENFPKNLVSSQR